jgi:hypothetical protein
LFSVHIPTEICEKMEKRGTKRPHEDTYDDSKVKVIYFDLETTGFNGQICSMAFLSSEGGSNFTKFLIPKCSFDPRATMVNKMFVRNDRLYQNGLIVETAVPIEDGLQQFVDWLTQLIENNDYGKIVLVSLWQNISYSYSLKT